MILKLGLNASMFMKNRISRILHNCFAIAWVNSWSHDVGVNTDYQLICTERNLYNFTSGQNLTPAKMYGSLKVHDYFITL